jgi:hypothetical protein
MLAGHTIKPLPKRNLLSILAQNGAFAALLTVVALSVGAFGYRVTEHMAWIDAFLDASMILSGMGQVSALHTTAGKIFASCYAIFSGFAFLSIVAVFLAPAYQRFLHRFHLDVIQREQAPGDAPEKK